MINLVFIEEHSTYDGKENSQSNFEWIFKNINKISPNQPSKLSKTTGCISRFLSILYIIICVDFISISRKEFIHFNKQIIIGFVFGIFRMKRDYFGHITFVLRRFFISITDTLKTKDLCVKNIGEMIVLRFELSFLHEFLDK